MATYHTMRSRYNYLSDKTSRKGEATSCLLYTDNEYVKLIIISLQMKNVQKVLKENTELVFSFSIPLSASVYLFNILQRFHYGGTLRIWYSIISHLSFTFQVLFSEALQCDILDESQLSCP